jgi:hypothetical protein
MINMSIHEAIASIIVGTDGAVLMSFIIMRLAGIINWDWGVVMSPVWLLALFIIIFIILPLILAAILRGAFIAFIFIYKKLRNRGKRK